VVPPPHHAPAEHISADAQGRVVEPPAPHGAPAAGALHFPPGGPAFVPPAGEGADTVEDGTPTEPAPPAGASTEGENRFAFFAAFRAAAEQAREEAGIDNRRGQ
jgi:hypothetical protein